jgi:hypothetical protein
MPTASPPCARDGEQDSVPRHVRPHLSIGNPPRRTEASTAPGKAGIESAVSLGATNRHDTGDPSFTHSATLCILSYTELSSERCVHD